MFESKLIQKLMKFASANMKKLFSLVNLSVTSYSKNKDLQVLASIGRSVREYQEARTQSDLTLIRALDSNLHSQVSGVLNKSKSQLRQDLFVLSRLNFKRGGYYVEFGATNGIDLSNSHILEKDFQWTGILAEPATIWHQSLRLNRPNSIIETSCLWKESGINLMFNETIDPEFSTIEFFSGSDNHKDTRINGSSYSVRSISLIDLLLKHNAPKHIDYLSIDTEGSEFEILQAFNFNRYTFGVITVEHNYTPQREKIYELLRANGYKRTNEDISMWDDWYVSDQVQQK